MSEIDPYLIHSLDSLQDGQDRMAEEGLEFFTEPVRLPMLLRVDRIPWTPGDAVPDIMVTSQVGNIVACRGSRRTLEALQNDPSVLNIEASRPGSGLDCLHSIPHVKADLVHTAALSPERGDQALVAVLDGGIDVLHEAFRDSSGKRSRILAVWDQSDPMGPAPTVKGIPLYGTLHDETSINGYITAGKVPPALGRDAKMSPGGGHGTHVTSIAAGRAVGAFAGGIAPDAKMIVVKTRISAPSDEIDPQSLGYSQSHVDALAWIGEFAETRELPVVVNVSQGMNAGAHDGTSLLELAFDDFVEGGRKPGRVVVKSAGNERQKDGHARTRLNSDDATDEFLWLCPAGRRNRVVIEVWYDSFNVLEFRLGTPIPPGSSARDWSDWVSVTDPDKKATLPSGNVCRLTLVRYHPDNGDTRLLVTVERGDAYEVEAGEWSLEVRSKTIKFASWIHAWLERIGDPLVRFTSHETEEMTLSIPGSARTVIAVGSVNTGWPLRVATYSSWGPTRDGRHKPDLSAPGESIQAAAGNSAHNVDTMSGTSMAAPHVTGAIALLLSRRAKSPNLRQYNAVQIGAAVRQMTQKFSGTWAEGPGYGVLDVEEFLATLT